MQIHKDDLTAIANILDMEEERINNEESILYDPSGSEDEFIHVWWVNSSDYLELDECPRLAARLAEWVRQKEWEIAQARGRGKEKKVLKLERELSTPQRVLGILQR